MIDPENGDYRVTPGSPAEGYGCQIFPIDFERKIENITEKTVPKRIKTRNTIEVSGIIDEDSFWDADTVKVVGNVIVSAGAVLTIPAGVIVEFQDFFSLDIQGSIQALGEAENRIRFTTSHPEFFMIDHSDWGAWNGIRFHNTSYESEASILQYCVFEYSKNTEPDGIGAAISCFDYSKITIENCLFQNNAADFGGAIGLRFNSNPLIISNIFTENYAFLGGAPIFCTDSYPKLINNTIAGNFVLNEDVFFNTGAIHTFQSKPLIYNNIIWDNSGFFLNENPLLFCKWYYTAFNDVNFDHPGLGNINADPLFTGWDDFSLTSGSPCINAGTLDLPNGIELPEFDLAGNPRIYGSTVDMGAYEWQGTVVEPEIPQISPQTTHISNFPNPFNPSTTIRFSIEQKEQNQQVKLIIYNIKGQKVKTLLDCTTAPGTYECNWNGKDEMGKSVSSGQYVVKLIQNGNETATKIMLLK